MHAKAKHLSRAKCDHEVIAPAHNAPCTIYVMHQQSQASQVHSASVSRSSSSNSSYAPSPVPPHDHPSPSPTPIPCTSITLPGNPGWTRPTRTPFQVKAIATGICQIFPQLHRDIQVCAAACVWVCLQLRFLFFMYYVCVYIYTYIMYTPACFWVQVRSHDMHVT